MSSPSDAPVRAPGSHTRSGNAMARTRSAILEAAARCLERDGLRRTTMSGVAETGGIAKATLYNHVRTKRDLLEALLLAGIDDLAERCAAAPDLTAALELAATGLAASGPLRRVLADEPDAVAALVRPGPGRIWDAARSAVASALSGAAAPHDPGSVDLVLRWLLTQAVSPGTPAEVAAGARALAAGLAAPGTGSVVRGLGWPAS